MSEKILVTGPFGQIGSELFPQLQKIYGKDNVVALGHNNIPADFNGILQKGDINDAQSMRKIIEKYKFTQVYYLAALLSAVGEKKPDLAWQVNLLSFKMMLDLAVQFKLRLFWPSSIGVFGPTSPKVNTPQDTVIQPTTMYGITKRTGQMLCKYYHQKYNLDVRSLRYPGIISWKAPPGGGTTDYAVAIFYDGVQHGKYTCFVNQNTTLPMMYMDDAVRAAIDVMQADPIKIKVRSSYNITAVSFTAKQLAEQVKKLIPDFTITYQPDQRQKIADSWPDSIDDSPARADWGWKHEFDLQKISRVMVQNLKKKKQSGGSL